MPSIEFDENHPLCTEDLIQALFEDKNDPRSNAYERVLNRPDIPWLRILLGVLLPLAVIAVFLILTAITHVSPKWRIAGVVAFALVYFVLTAKKAAILLVKIYQRYAPDSVRNHCRFEPSCSEYMIGAIEKYGLLRGVVRGIRRLMRCNVNGGGFDPP